MRSLNKQQRARLAASRAKARQQDQENTRQAYELWQIGHVAPWRITAAWRDAIRQDA